LQRRDEMKGERNATTGIRIAATVLAGVFATAASAQQERLDTRNLDPSVQAASCAAVDWNEDLLAQYPRIAEGCQEVVTSEGKRWARFGANFVRSNRDGSVTLDFQNRQGRSMEELTLMPAQGQRVSIDGRPYRFSELTRGQQLNLYVPEGMYALALEPGAPPEQLAQVVAPPAQGVQLAQADRAPAAAAPARQLPNTAGPLPLLALGGLASVLAGLALSIRRRFSVGK
jgi:hypothetical protein